MKIAGISSTKAGDVNEGELKNRYLYNEKELWDEGDLNWYDYGFRNYDPQIGRFPQLDPLTWDYPELTNYQYAGCEPIANVDLDGLEPLGVLKGTVTVAGKVSMKIVAPVAEKVALTVVKQSAKVVVMQAAKSPSLWSKLGMGLLSVGTKATNVFLLVITPQDMGTGDVPRFVFSPLNQPNSQPNPNSKLVPDNDEDDEDNPDAFVYREGSNTDKTFTPRPGIDDDVRNPKYGLSVKRFPTPGVKSQKLSIKRLYKSGFVLSNHKGHTSIVPNVSNMETHLKEWSATRNSLPDGSIFHPNSHLYTRAIHFSRVGRVR